MLVLMGLFHARRKFDEAVKGLSKKDQADSIAMIGKKFCDKLFALERDFADLTAEERLAKRQELSKPVLGEFYKWVYAVKPAAQNRIRRRNRLLKKSARIFRTIPRRRQT
jgi:hypothetical protein